MKIEKTNPGSAGLVFSAHEELKEGGETYDELLYIPRTKRGIKTKTKSDGNEIKAFQVLKTPSIQICRNGSKKERIYE